MVERLYPSEKTYHEICLKENFIVHLQSGSWLRSYLIMVFQIKSIEAPLEEIKKRLKDWQKEAVKMKEFRKEIKIIPKEKIQNRERFEVFGLNKRKIQKVKFQTVVRCFVFLEHWGLV